MSAALIIEKQKVRQSFAASVHSYDDFAWLQRQVGLDLISQFDFSITNKYVVDLGCGTGFLMQQLTQATPVQQMLAIDIAQPMLQASRNKLAHLNNIQFICADAEKLPLLINSVDTLVSNLALQWCRNLPSVLQDIKQVLKPRGHLLFSTFGAETLQELKHSWAQVDRYKHVNDFYTEQKIHSFLQYADFKSIQIKSKQYNIQYPSVMALMKALKGIGANRVLSGANQKTTRRLQMQAMIDAYEEYRMNGSITATYATIFVSAKKQ